MSLYHVYLSESALLHSGWLFLVPSIRMQISRCHCFLIFSSTPLCKCTTFSFSILWLRGIWVVSRFHYLMTASLFINVLLFHWGKVRQLCQDIIYMSWISLLTLGLIFSSILRTPSPISVVMTCISPYSLFLHHMLSSRNASDFRNFHSCYF